MKIINYQSALRNFCLIFSISSAGKSAMRVALLLLYGTAKTHKFDNIEDITLENLKFRPIIAQSRTYTQKATQVIADYLKPLCSDNHYIIRNTQEFPKLLQQQDPLLPNEE